MKEVREAAIKLFGKEIELPEIRRIPSVPGHNSGGDEDGRSYRDPNPVIGACLEDEKVRRTEEEKQGEEEEKEVEADDKDSLGGKPTESNQEPSPDSEDNPKTPSIDEENASAKPPKIENDQSDANNSQEKPTLKKPDKILPCPRCNSMDTKFCYYNNYNINQPRHFCKSCQRYWTAGGTMRNVPVGAGRRKNKNSASHFRHITIPEVYVPNGIHHPMKANATVLSFGPQAAPFCESIASVLNLVDKKGSSKGGENVDDCSSGSSVTTSNSAGEGGRNGIQEPMVQTLNGFPSQIPCLPGIPFPYPWNSAIPVCPPPGFPMPFYPAAPYWNCSIPGGIPFPYPCFPVPNSSNLGKHSREGELLNPSKVEGKESENQKSSERSVLIPKTLRIDDPDEAARSSIWATLGIKNDFFKGFEPKGEKKSRIAETPTSLRVNPAALSRSLGFQETA